MSFINLTVVEPQVESIHITFKEMTSSLLTSQVCVVVKSSSDIVHVW